MTGLPHSFRGFDSIWVIIDRMTKSAYFPPIKTTYSASCYTKLYMDEIVRLHGIPVSIISDYGHQFTFYFWKAFQKALETRLDLSMAFHLKKIGHPKMTIQTLKDMLKSCVLDFWEIGIVTYLWWSFLTITATKLVFRWCRLKPSIGDIVDLPSNGLKLVKLSF